jgi:biopolymer transport protein ExbB
MKLKHFRIIIGVIAGGLLWQVPAGAAAERSVEAALQELADVRAEIEEAKVPLARELMELEAEVLELRREADRQQRLRDSGGVDLNALEVDVKARTEEMDYITSLITEYLTSLETRAEPVELAAYRERLDAALVAVDHPEWELSEQLQQQMAGIELGYERLEQLLGGAVMAGNAVGPDGDIISGDFILYGPASYFSDGSIGGLALRGDTEFPVLFELPGSAPALAATADGLSGELPLDGSMGKAVAMAGTKESLMEHILKGGVWIFPILFAAGLSLAIACFKFFEIGGMKPADSSVVRGIVKSLREGDRKAAHEQAVAVGNPAAGLLEAGIEYADEPKELLEEILLEKIVETQPKVDRLLPVIALTAATAPLLGLLGTVTGMINTFKLITVFGTGDAKSLSSGISEALITTEFGLIVAIPSLILHALLNRKAKGIIAGLESNAMTFINGISAGRSR